MLNSNQYYYDAQTFEYVKDNRPIKLFAGLSVTAFLLSIILVVCTFPYWAQLEKHYYQEEQLRLSKGIVKVNQRLLSFEKQLNKMHHNDQSFYRSILNEKPIDPAIWEGGTGGTRNTNLANVPPPLREVINRITKLNYKLEVQDNSFDKINEIALAKAEVLKHVPCIRPLNGKIVSGFGYRNDPYFGHGHFHAGVDIVAQIGTPIAAVADGTIITAGYTATGYGIEIEIDHGKGYVTKYAHLSSTKANKGSKVKRGEIIGYTGSTGYSTGPHLHYEVIKNGEKVNPLDYFYVE